MVPNKFTVIVNGRFHAFDYAAELHKMNKLDKLISTMPYSKAKEFGIPKDLYKGFPLIELIKITYRKIFRKELPLIAYSSFFCKIAKKHIPSTTNTIISFAGYSKEIFEDPENAAKLKILDRGSTHTLANIHLKREAAEYHNTTFTQHPENFIKRELKEYELADFIMVPSSFVEETFINNQVPKRKIIVNPYAFSTKKFSNNSNEDLKIRKDNTILFVGQLSPRKGIKVLVNAFITLKKQLPNAKLWLVGALNDIDREMVKQDGIIYFGVLKGDDLKEKFQRATLFCLPSFEEGLALVLTEARHFGLPIVATPNTGVEELFVKDDAQYTLFEAGNEKELTRILLKKLNDIQNKEKSNNLKGKTWEGFTQNLLKNIEHVTVQS